MFKFQMFDLVGYAATCFGIYAAVARTMIPLRSAAICANVLSMAFSMHNGNLPNFILSTVVLPLNVMRLFDMISQIRAVKGAVEGQFNIDWLRPFMERRKLVADEVLFNRGDVADRAYFIRNGTVLLPEIGVRLRAGQLFGEMGMITQGNVRSQSAVAEGPVELLCIGYDEFKQLALQNPEFGFYLMRLIVQRLEANQSLKAALPA